MHDDVVSAARATLAAGSARIRRTRLSAAGEVSTTEEGVTDFAARRTRVEFAPGPKLEAVAERLGSEIDERWPWLFGEDDADDAPHTVIYAGTAAFQGGEGSWSVLGEGECDATRRRAADPTWLLEALCGAHVISHATDEPGRVDFEPNLTRLHAELELPPHRGSTPPRIGGEAWTDDEGRLTRLTWRNLTYVRRARQDDDRPRRPGSQRLELWDFGLPVAIEVPEIPQRLPGSGLVDWVRIGWDLRRRRREYRGSTP